MNIYLLNEIFLKKFKKVIFNFYEESFEEGGICNVELFELERIEFDFYLYWVYKESEYESIPIKNVIFQTLNHEIIHTKHILYEKTKILVSKVRLQRKIEKIKEKYISNNKITEKRLILEEIFGLLLSEGLASFYELERDLSLVDFKNELDSENLVLNLNLMNKYFIQNEEELEEFMKIIYYPLGKLMVYSILIGSEEITVENLFALDNIKFVELYEKSIERINKKYNENFKVLFSYSSKKGILDYTQIINRLKKLEREERKNN